MAGPYPPEYGAGPAGPQMYPESFPQHRHPPPPGAARHYPENIPSAYPGMLPPPVQYPKRRRWRAVAIALALIAVLAAIAAAIVLLARSDNGGGATALNSASAKVAIQDYLDALADGDDETVARHLLCGLYDDVKERRSDLALAGLSSDAFRKQYSRAEVTSIDKMIVTSPDSGAGVVHHARDSGARVDTRPTGRRWATGRRSATGPGRRDPGLLLPAAHCGSVLTAEKLS